MEVTPSLYYVRQVNEVVRTLMIFVHQRSLKKGRILELSANLLFIALFLDMASYLVFIQEKPSGILFGNIIFLVVGLIFPFLTWRLIRFYRGTGVWKVQITQNEVIWQTPDNVGEKSFKVQLSDISKIICEFSRDIDGSDWYYIETKGGEKYHLNPSASGVNLNKFCNVLESLGVKHEVQYKPLPSRGMR